MDAVEFLKQLKRRSKSNPDYYGEELIISYIDPESLVAQVECWAEENPIKTRQSVFLEQYPQASIGNDGVLTVYPFLIDASYRSSEGGCVFTPRNCFECRKGFWLQEVD